MTSEAFKQANALFVDEDYEGALKLYNQAIQENSNIAEYYTKRAAAHIKLENFLDAIDDSKSALKLDPNNAVAYLRMGTAFFEQDEFESAREAFQNGLKVSPADQQLAKWLRKCDAELEGENKKSSTTTTTTQQQTSKPTTTTTTAPLAPTPAPAPTEPVLKYASAEHLPPPTPNPIPPRQLRFRHEFFQSSTHVMLTVFAKGLKKEDVEVDFEPRSVSVSIKLPAEQNSSSSSSSSSSSFDLNFDLFDDIDPKLSKVDVLSMKVELKMKKVREVQWDSFEASASQSASVIKNSAVAPTTTTPAFSSVSDPAMAKNDPKQYPSSSSKKKNWDKIDTEITKETEKDKPEGDEALNQLFRQIYANADEDTRRAMNKSFQESGGTVLSTNWKEVGAKKVEGSPPNGMQWNNWNK